MAVWFRAKRYGWGWTPVTIQGWLVVAAFAAATTVDTVVFIRRIRGGDDIRSTMVVFILWLAFLTGALITICWKTGERPRWRWGN
jgi:hypothetical protein